jgi:hypothetical protein
VPEVLNWCWGSLSAGVYIHPTTQHAHAAEFEQLLEAMEYGTVVVNSSGLVGFGMMQLVWGGYPGSSTLADVQSGVGFVHNRYVLQLPPQHPREQSPPPHIVQQEVLQHTVY